MIWIGKKVQNHGSNRPYVHLQTLLDKIIMKRRSIWLCPVRDVNRVIEMVDVWEGAHCFTSSHFLFFKLKSNSDNKNNNHKENNNNINTKTI